VQEKNNQYLLHRYVEVLEATSMEMEAGQVSRTPLSQQRRTDFRFNPYGGKGKGFGGKGFGGKGFGGKGMPMMQPVQAVAQVNGVPQQAQQLMVRQQQQLGGRGQPGAQFGRGMAGTGMVAAGGRGQGGQAWGQAVAMDPSQAFGAVAGFY